jgi:hypothetical protein
VKLSGKWNKFVDAVRCDSEGNPIPDAPVKRLWECTPKPANDYYSFTQYAHKLNSSEGIRTPMASDSRYGPEWLAGLALAGLACC